MQTLLFSVLPLLSLTAWSQTIAPIELVNVANDKIVAIKPCSTCKGVVVIFSSLKCAYDQHYQSRIKALSEKYNGKISFFLVNANQEAEEDDTKMKAAYATWNTSLPLLSDKKQVAIKAYNATRTPEAILLKLNGKDLTIVYQGAIDDNPQVESDTEVNYLDNALGELLAGKTISVNKERVIGCIIRKAE